MGDDKAAHRGRTDETPGGSAPQESVPALEDLAIGEQEAAGVVGGRAGEYQPPPSGPVPVPYPNTN